MTMVCRLREECRTTSGFAAILHFLTMQTFSHPQSQYFVVGRLGRDQLVDYAQRKGITLIQAEKFLAAHLDYDPE